MKKLILTLHTTLDGFVAGPKGEMDWIHVDTEIFDYAGKMTNDADTAFYGRVTYEMMDSYWPEAANKPGASDHDVKHSRWYNKVSKVVMSHTLQSNPQKNLKIISGDIPSHINKLKALSGKNIQMFGSPSAAHTLMEHNLIDEYWLFVNPVLIGSGIPFASGELLNLKLKLLSTKTFSSGVVGLHYGK
jgi:dihydrofolate reductase